MQGSSPDTGSSNLSGEADQQNATGSPFPRRGGGRGERGPKNPGLVFAAIAPHGGEIIPELAGRDLPRMGKTRTAMRELGRRAALARPETVVVLTPHGQMVEGAISIGMTARAVGTLGERAPAKVSAAFRTDRDLARLIGATGQQQNVPILGIIAGDKNEDAERIPLPLDWGALVPLWFVAHPLEPRPQVIVMAPDRSLPREKLVRCGVAIAQAAQASNKRVALIASCDQGHAHDPDGPYGFDPASRVHDKAMVAAIANDELPRLLDRDNDFLEAAKVDAYWQTLILAGALGHTPMTPELLSYEAPTYFGMAVAAYQPR